jgi:uncharacterized repeat protein (TIGR01451 family)
MVTQRTGTAWRYLGVAAALTALACGEQSRTPTAVMPAPPNADIGIAASLGGNLDQWANGTNPPTGESWQNGNLNGNNSRYAEGKAVPFRYAIEGLTAGNHFVTIQYDFTAGGHKAYDFLASIEFSEPNALTKICAVGGGGVSSLCSGGAMSVGSTTFPFTPDGFSANGLTVDDAITDSPGPRNLRIFGGTITSISTVSHTPDVNGNSTGEMVVEFTTTTSSAVLLAWSGHLARSTYWDNPGTPDGAGEVSGAPWHMRTLNLDGGGAANQDRSIQPSALPDNPAISIVKSTTTGTVSAGSQISYTIVVTTNGPGTANNVTIVDNLPPGSDINWDFGTNPGGCAVNGSPPSETLNCTFTTLAQGASQTVTVVSATKFASCGTYQNSATAGSSNGDGEVTSDIIQIKVECPNLDVVKTPDAQTVAAGNAISFSVVVSNAGPGTAKGVQLSDPLPGGKVASPVTWALGTVTSSGSPTIGTLPACAVTGSAGSQSLDCPSIDLTAGQAYTVTVSANTTTANCTVYNNTATASATNENLNETDNGQNTVQCPPDIRVDKTPDNQFVSAGDAITFTIAVSNAGEGTATGVALSDALPGGNAGAPVTWSIVGGAATSTGSPVLNPLPTCLINGAAGSQVLSCAATTLTAGQAYTVAVTASTSRTSCTAYNNQADLTATNDDPVSNSGKITVDCPNLALVKTPDQQLINAGETMTFSIVVSNGGPGTAKGVQLSDNLPGGNSGTYVTWTKAAGSPTSTGATTLNPLPTCSIGGPAGSQVLTCSSIDMPANTAYTVTVSAVTSTTSCMLYDNLATATATNSLDKTDHGTIDVRCPSACTLTIGFWKTHAGEYKWGMGNQGDAITALLNAPYAPLWLGTANGAKSVLVPNVQTAVKILTFNLNPGLSTASNGITKLYAQMLAARLNQRNGAPISAAVQTAFNQADLFLATKGEADWKGLTKAQQNQVLNWMSTFDTFNNSGHCP